MCIGVLRHYISVLLASQKKIEIQQLQDSQVILRSRILRENARFIPKSSFNMRRLVFNNAENGYLTQKRENAAPNMMTDPSMMTDMLKGNITNVLPMIIIGGWINWMFSGFITTKVPFPLTLRFKPMLQRVLGENNAADQSKQMQDQMSGAAMAMPPDPKVAFKAEWEGLEIIEHQWALADIENTMTIKDK
ncbi:Integral membrane protein EMC3/TMCO1-like [Popillia japonica]|uniref:ER membrane protein complex subunit 3 n=1 Tax=Popillia japonica TaxID=7064 RepID=A0AAW1LCB2_POPJA